MRVLITGASGFTARHLVKLLSDEPRQELYLTGRMTKGGNDIYACDLTEPGSALTLVKRVKPQQIYHLAGSFSNEYETDYKTNVVATKNLLEAIVNLKLDCRVLLVGSAAEYGYVNARDNPINENHPLRPITIYGLTKAYQSKLMHFYHWAHSLDLVMARTFNLLGKGMSERLFVGHVDAQIGQLIRGERTKIVVGNLHSRRDYINVTDAVTHYRTIINQGSAGEIYNVGSGKPIKMLELLATILGQVGLGMEVVEQIGQAAATRNDVPEVFADISKLRQLTG